MKKNTLYGILYGSSGSLWWGTVGVIYFKTPQRPKCGNIVFEHPFSGIDFFTNGAKVDETTKYNYPAYYWNAEPNLLLLFPLKDYEF